ncbi:hypothetical protein G7Z17_g11196 [Cylindrodendrum hubeiense]|uniref:Xylanolytic transcriptional activator regulatory domain-containing protein n=1 Tax=Cylindrodendrum hubeiense TaxID=595255 RepID=A0A9P5H4E7_9HYPO|nr:hypothetical protein G7Z17_g11196 [Cylindrodendrum hubeiense]
MSPTPPSTNSSQGGRSPEEQFRVVRKRNRVPLSCYPCRTRKYVNPMHALSAPTLIMSADFARKKNQSQGDSSPDDMQNHAATAAAAAATTQSTTDSGSSAKVEREDEAVMVDDDDESDTEEGLAASLGFLKVDTDKGKSLYVGQEHWHTILADISEVKNYFTSHKKELESSYERVMSSKPMAAREGPTLLFGAIPASEIEIRAELPPKSSVLTLCGRYFNSMDNAVNIIHGPTFQKQLRVHWQDPSKTPIMWLGLLYSVLCLAMLSYHKVGDEPPEWKGRTLELANEYRLRTVQCLIKSDYTKPVEYTVETMILYVFGEYSSRWDADLGLWLIVSLITRIAFRMGYHRDAKWFPSLTPFQAEMRRRTWALVRMCDVIFSHQVSLPSMIYEHDCDTQLPNNVFDDEFHPDIKSMPPSRPPTEPTPIAYMIAKSRLCNELGNILQATNRVGKHVQYDEIIRFDAKLRQVMQELPPHLKLTSLESSHDPVTLIVARFNVDILYQKILCLLHRKYLPRARQSARYAHSRRSAIEASLQALDHLAILHRESQSSGRLRSVHWYVKSIATKDFILPAMLVILDLHFDNIAAQASTQQQHEGTFLYTQEQRSRMTESLETAREIWKTLADTSMEAFKATKIIEIMLEKIKNPEPGGEIHPGLQSEPMQDLASSIGIDPSPSMTPSIISPNSLPEFNTGMNPFSPPNPAPFMGMDFGLSAPEGVDMQTEGFGAAGPASPFSSMFNNMGSASSTGIDLNTNFDWNAFESYTQMANWGADQSFQIYGAEGDPSSPNKSSTSGGAGGTGGSGGGGSSAGGGGGAGDLGESAPDAMLTQPAQLDDDPYSLDISTPVDSDTGPTDDADDDPIALLRNEIPTDGSLINKRKSPASPNPSQPVHAKRARIDEDEPRGSKVAPDSAVDRAKQLPAEIWHHIFTFSTAAGDQWHRGPGAKGVSPVFPFSVSTCGNCLTSKSVKVTKVFWSHHLEEIKSEFESVKLLGSAAAEEWVKGLEIRGKQALADASRWEKWDLAGGVYRMRSFLSSVSSAPLDLTNTSNTGPVCSQPSSGHSSEHVHPNLRRHAEHQRQVSDQSGVAGLITKGDANSIQPRPQGQQKRTKEEVAELKLVRRRQIERRAWNLEPPIHPSVLAHIPSFQAALQIITPLDESAWELLKPRILAQREEAELREKEKIANTRALQERLEINKEGLVVSKEPREVADKDWDDIQGPLRARISSFADEIIRDGWNDGDKVKKKNSPQFAADVLLYVRKRFYAEVAKDAAAAVAAGLEPILDPPEGPWTQKLTLENMKWIFDVKIKQHTEQYRKELFLCHGCIGNLKFYGFEGVIQHYAAKHTSALSVGSVVVHWRAEWPEVPPFSPDARLPEVSHHSQPPGISLSSSGTQPYPAYGVYHPGPPAGYPTPGYAAPVPHQFISGQHTPFSPANLHDPRGPSAYGAPQHPPPYAQDGGYSSYPPRPVYGTPNHPLDPPEGFGYASSAPRGFNYGPYHDTRGSYGNQHPGGIYKARLDTMIRVAREAWNKISGVKDLPTSVKICVVVHCIAKTFQDEFAEPAPLAMLIDGLSNHKEMRPVRNTNGLACKACSTSHNLTQKTNFSLPQLANHFNKSHVEGPVSQGLPSMDWRIEMILLPDMSVLRGLKRIIENNRPAYELVASTLPWAFEEARADHPPQRELWSGPVDQPLNGMPHRTDDHPLAQSREYDIHRREPNIPDINEKHSAMKASRRHEYGRTREPEFSGDQIPHATQTHSPSSHEVPNLRPASEVYARKKGRVEQMQGRHPHDSLGRDSPRSDHYAGAVVQADQSERREAPAGHGRPGSSHGGHGAHVRDDRGLDYRDAEPQRYASSAHPRERAVAPSDRWEEKPRRLEQPLNPHPPGPVTTRLEDDGFGLLDALESHLEMAHEEIVPKYAAQTYRHEPEPIPHRVYYDDLRPLPGPPVQAYELVEVRDPQGDYFIKRPIRRDEREPYMYEDRPPPGDLGAYPPYGLVDEYPTTRTHGYATASRPTSLAPGRPKSRMECEEYDPRYPATGSGEPAQRHSRR